MNARLLPLSFIGLIVLLSRCQPAPEPTFPDYVRYTHQVYTDEECKRRFQQGGGVEISCGQTIFFRPDGRVDLGLSGDIMFGSTYQRRQSTIEIAAVHSVTDKIMFRVLSDTKLFRISDGTVWEKQ
jgi:hypothetical protein